MKRKNCNTCGKLKPISGFYKRPRLKSGYDAECKECTFEKSRKVKDRIKSINERKTLDEYLDESYRGLPKGTRRCRECSEIKTILEFTRIDTYSNGFFTKCYDCENSYRRDLKESRSDEDRRQQKARQALITSRYRARKIQLPDTLTELQVAEILNRFSSKCSVCESEYQHLDHFIPVSSGYGGTTLENIVPMCGRCNMSKGAKNPFEWAETLPTKDRERFDSLVEYLTVINGIATVEDYEAHVNQCFN